MVGGKERLAFSVLWEMDKDTLEIKRVKYGKKYLAHDENNEAKVGDLVELMETRKLSSNKHFRLVKIVARADDVK